MRKYKIIGIVSFLVGAVYTARAFTLLKAPGELPMTNSYLLVIGVLLCASALGVYIYGTFAPLASKFLQSSDAKSSEWRQQDGYLVFTLVCFILFALLLEKLGTFKASFILSFLLGAIWNHNKGTSIKNAKKYSFIEYCAANRVYITGNIVASCIYASGIWLFYIRIFNLSLP